ncbi:hypothetical protein TorRG33x02_263420 [Trema orientale]|uniref:Uncharacterized protein n=1 Tax=Trema orientale TaxID=63057 RepID=A0A2P5D3N0_TREOI|nr:hypothetical protein TorRG33x02_263420 [Trema orientale]
MSLSHDMGCAGTDEKGEQAAELRRRRGTRLAGVACSRDFGARKSEVAEVFSVMGVSNRKKEEFGEFNGKFARLVATWQVLACWALF